jgi:DNA polymerase-3 subunit chi
MARLTLHPLPGSKRAGRLAQLVDELFRDGRRVVVWVADDANRQALDDYLWTFAKLAFVPHALWGPAMGKVDDPVVLVGEASNPNSATVLVVGDELPSGDWAATFDEVHDLIPEGPEGEARASEWELWRERSDAGPS